MNQEFELDNAPNSDLIYDLFGGIFKPQFVRLACLALTAAWTPVIDCPVFTASPGEHTSFITLFLWANDGGMAYSHKICRSFLESAGFRSVAQVGERWSIARK